MADDLTLFETPERAAPPPHESEGASRTRRQSELLAAGQHPLTLVLTRPLRLHPEAAPHDDRKADGRRCGDCAFRTTNHRGYPKCGFGDGVRASHGAGTDCRAWWPACADHNPGDHDGLVQP